MFLQKLTQARKKSFGVKVLSHALVGLFLSSIVSPNIYAQTISLPVALPVPGTMLQLSKPFDPVTVKGIIINPEHPFKFDFVMDSGDTGLQGEALRPESMKTIKYFLAALTLPEDEMWVNLSPYEKNRIIPKSFGETAMGRDVLAQDYILKEVTASLTYPEQRMGKEFWDKVYAKAWAEYHTTNIPVNTFNKVWILPSKAKVYEYGNGAFVVKSRLKVMLEEDYLSLSKHAAIQTTNKAHTIASQIVREIIIPALEKEVNEGKNFANLRQVYQAMILATWYKIRLKDSILGQLYVNQNKIKGVALNDKQATEKIYRQYLQAFRKGVYNYIKEDYDPKTQQVIPRKYISGGFAAAIDEAMTVEPVSKPVLLRALRSGGLVSLFLASWLAIAPIIPTMAAQPSTTSYAGSNSQNEVTLSDNELSKVMPINNLFRPSVTSVNGGFIEHIRFFNPGSFPLRNGATELEQGVSEFKQGERMVIYYTTDKIGLINVNTNVYLYLEGAQGNGIKVPVQQVGSYNGAFYLVIPNPFNRDIRVKEVGIEVKGSQTTQFFVTGAGILPPPVTFANPSPVQPQKKKFVTIDFTLLPKDQWPSGDFGYAGMPITTKVYQVLNGQFEAKKGRILAIHYTLEHSPTHTMEASLHFIQKGQRYDYQPAYEIWLHDQIGIDNLNPDRKNAGWSQLQYGVSYFNVPSDMGNIDKIYMTTGLHVREHEAELTITGLVLVIPPTEEQGPTSQSPVQSTNVSNRANPAMSSRPSTRSVLALPFRRETRGGIDLNAVNLDLEIKRDDKGMPLPFKFQNLNKMRIDTLYPTNLQIGPPISVPALLGSLVVKSLPGAPIVSSQFSKLDRSNIRHENGYIA